MWTQADVVGAVLAAFIWYIIQYIYRYREETQYVILRIWCRVAAALCIFDAIRIAVFLSK